MVMNALRDGAKSGVSKFILFGFLVLATGGLVMMDVGGFFRGGVSNSDVAKIGRQTISVQSFDMTVRRTLARLGIGPQEAYRLGYINQILNGEVRSILLGEAASNADLRISRRLVAEQIETILAPFTAQGQDPKSTLEQVLRNQGMNERYFVHSIARDMRNELLSNTITNSFKPLNDDVTEDLFRYQNETRDIEYVAFMHGDLKDLEPPGDEQLQGLYEKTRQNYAIDETRRLKLVSVDMKALKDKVAISDEEIRQTYDNNIDLYTVNETRTLQQALLPTQEQANKVLSAVKDGKALEQALKDTIGNSAAYLGERDVTPDQMIEEVKDEVMKTENPGAVLGPISSPLGYYIVVVKKINPKSVKSFESVRADIKDELLDNALIDEQYAMANTVDDLFASGASVEDVAQEVDIDVQTLPEINQYGLGRDGKNALEKFDSVMSEILQSGFELQEGETSPVFETKDGHMMAVHVEHITPKSFKSFEDVKSELKDRWMLDQKRVGAQIAAMQFVGEIKETGKSLRDAAQDSGKIVTIKRALTREGENAGALTPRAVSNIFNAGLGQPVLVDVEGGLAIAVVTNFNWPEKINKESDDYKTLVSNLREGSANEGLALYLQGVQNDVGVKVNQDILENTYGAEPQGY